MTTCIPIGQGVPGMSGPPNWLAATASSPIRTDLDDPRWRGAVRQGFPLLTAGVTSDQALFRAVYAGSGASRSLYVSWQVKADSSADNLEDLVYVGFRSGTGSMIIKAKVFGAASPFTCQPAHSFDVLQKTAGGWAAVAEPTWIAANTRAWLTAAPVTWAIQMRVPLNPAGGSIVHANGPDLGDDFRLWYCMYVSLPGPNTQHAWPQGQEVTFDDFDNEIYPDPNNWGEFHLRTGAPGEACSTDGISLAVLDVGTTNTPNSLIHRPPVTNTFFARPRYDNSTPGAVPLPAGSIRAHFRLANWGSIATPAPWVDIPGGSDVPSTSALPVGAPTPGSTPIHFDWPTPTNNADPFAGKTKHQCMLVELTGPGLTFANDSVYRNMDFDAASLIERPAEVSVAGLSPVSAGQRDLYILVERRNAPTQAPAGYVEAPFMGTTIDRIIREDKGNDPESLGNRLRRVREQLSDAGDAGRGNWLRQLVEQLNTLLASLPDRDPAQGKVTRARLVASTGAWFGDMAGDKGSAARFTALVRALVEWLEASGSNAVLKAVAFVDQLRRWLEGLSNDPRASERLSQVTNAFEAWLNNLSDQSGSARGLAGVVQALNRWLSSDRSPAQLPALLEPLQAWLSSLGSGPANLRKALVDWLNDLLQWFDGSHVEMTFLNGLLAEIQVTPEELDRIYPTVRFHVFHDTGRRRKRHDGRVSPILAPQSSFGFYAYHEGALDGWVTSLQGATKIADNFYLLKAPNEGAAQVKTRIQAAEPGEERIPEDQIGPIPGPDNGGCLEKLLRMLGLKR
jgi:hypothetical protein